MHIVDPGKQSPAAAGLLRKIRAQSFWRKFWWQFPQPPLPTSAIADLTLASLPVFVAATSAPTALWNFSCASLNLAGERTEVLALQGHRRLALFDQYLGLDLREGAERVSRAERDGKSGQKKPLFHSILLDQGWHANLDCSGIRRMGSITVPGGGLFRGPRGRKPQRR